MIIFTALLIQIGTLMIKVEIHGTDGTKLWEAIYDDRLFSLIGMAEDIERAGDPSAEIRWEQGVTIHIFEDEDIDHG